MRAAVYPALKLMMDAVHRYEGYVAQSTGDGIFALFGAPIAHEDHAQRALLASLKMQEDLKRYAAKLREKGSAPIEIRVGLNTGEMVVRSVKTGEHRTEYTPIGHSTSLAARMQALAPTGSIAVSEQTQKLVEGYFEFKPLGPTRVKGVSEPVNVYELIGLGPLRTRLQLSSRRGLSRFVGRDREIEEMKRALERTIGGRGQVVAAMGEAARQIPLVLRVQDDHGRRMPDAGGVFRLPWQGLRLPPVDRPAQELFRDHCRGCRTQAARKRVTGKVLALDRTVEDTLIYLFSLLGVSDAADPLAPRADVDQARKSRRSSLDACRHLRPVHRRLRSPRSDRRQGVAGPTERIAGSVCAGLISSYPRISVPAPQASIQGGAS
jgi:hypothetical protein